MKFAIVLLCVVAAAMEAQSGGLVSAHSAGGYAHPAYGYTQPTYGYYGYPAFGFAHPSATYYGGGAATAAGQTPAATYYAASYPMQKYYYTYGYPATAAGSAPAAGFYHHTPSVSSNQYHAQDVAGQYSYGYATSDGQAKVEQKNLDGSVSGKFSYMDPTGKFVETKYTAGKDGFKAEGDHLPKSAEEPELSDEVKAAYEKAMDEFEDAKNRKGPDATVAVATAQVAPAETYQTYQTPFFYSAPNAHFMNKPYGAAKSSFQYAYTA